MHQSLWEANPLGDSGRKLGGTGPKLKDLSLTSAKC